MVVLARLHYHLEFAVFLQAHGHVAGFSSLGLEVLVSLLAVRCFLAGVTLRSLKYGFFPEPATHSISLIKKSPLSLKG